MRKHVSRQVHVPRKAAGLRTAAATERHGTAQSKMQHTRDVAGRENCLWLACIPSLPSWYMFKATLFTKPSGMIPAATSCASTWRCSQHDAARPSENMVHGSQFWQLQRTCSGRHHVADAVLQQRATSDDVRPTVIHGGAGGTSVRTPAARAAPASPM